MYKNIIPNISLLVGEITAFALSTTIVLILLPHVALQLLACFIIAYLIPRFIYSRSNIVHITGQWAILIAALIIAIGITINIWQFTEVMGGTISHPILINNDSGRFYKVALAMYYGNEYGDSVAFLGFPFIISLIWKVTGVSILVPLFLNMLFTLLSIVISAFISVRLLSTEFEGKSRIIGSIAIIITGSCCYYLGCGMIILKEPGLYLGVAMTGYSLTTIYRPRKRATIKEWTDIIIFAIGAIFIALNRVAFCYVVILGILLLTSYRSKQILRKAVLMFIIIIGITFIGNELATYGVSNQVEIAKGSKLETLYMTTAQQQAYGNIIGDYFHYPLWKRTVLLPVSMITQYLIPFPWNFMRDTPFGYSQIYSHFTYPWYLIGGIILFYYLFVGWKKKSNIGLWSVWALICFSVPAFFFAGSVSRYWLPFLPLFVPSAVYVILSLYNNKNNQKLFTIFAKTYIIVLICTLLICHYLQKANL
ncbi:MAG: hypothetical protein RR442_04545 [Muribaculaceae bacterium]